MIIDFNVEANNSAMSALVTHITSKTSLKSQPAIRTPISLRALTLC